MDHYSYSVPAAAEADCSFNTRYVYLITEDNENSPNTSGNSTLEVASQSKALACTYNFTMVHKRDNVCDKHLQTFTALCWTTRLVFRA